MTRAERGGVVVVLALVAGLAVASVVGEGPAPRSTYDQVVTTVPRPPGAEDVVRSRGLRRELRADVRRMREEARRQLPGLPQD